MLPSLPRIRQPGVLAWLRLVRLYQLLSRREVEHLTPYGLSPAQFDILAHVGAREGQCQQELADSLLVTKGNITQLLDRLEQAGLLERRPAGRSNQLYLTQAGRELVAEVVPAHEAVMAEPFARLSREDQIQLLALLRRLEQHSKEPAHAGRHHR